MTDQPVEVARGRLIAAVCPSSGRRRGASIVRNPAPAKEHHDNQEGKPTRAAACCPKEIDA
jgi:hypothetical protein